LFEILNDEFAKFIPRELRHEGQVSRENVQAFFAAIRRKERKRIKELFVSFLHLCGKEF